jgi:hypothetical protein
MNRIKYLKAKHIDYSETVAEEIGMSMGLQTKVNEEGTITVDTIAGPLLFNPIFKDLMQDFYRFVYCYGSKLSSYGIEERIKVANKTFNTNDK